MVSSFFFTLKPIFAFFFVKLGSNPRFFIVLCVFSKRGKKTEGQCKKTEGIVKYSLKQIERQSQYFNEDFVRERKALSDDIREYDSKVEELDTLNLEIGGVREDIGKLKQQEQSYNQKIISLTVEKRSKESYIQSERNCRIEISGAQEIYQKQDEKTKKLQAYYAEYEYLKNRINKFIARKEKEKREKLAGAINEIFKDFYDEKISFSLDSSYGV